MVQRRAVRAALGLGDDPAGEPFLVALGVRELLSRHAARHPLIVIADDLHWLDGAARTVLGIIGRRLREHRIVLLAAVRDGYDEITGDLEFERLTLGVSTAQLLRRFSMPGPES